ncbi:MAG: NUDIX domain-containing protein [Acidobacteriota bacterium]|nr:NUDIX domain-containing protein [Acidobacteriota bacterium]
MHKLEPAAPEPATTPRKLVYETSAGGVVLRHMRGTWQVAIIEPNIINADTVTRRVKARPQGTVFALPKGGVDPGETPEQGADREVWEETGIRGQRLFRLTTIRYVYVRSWGGREQVSKSVCFYMFLYGSGRLGQIRPDMRDEVRRAFWFPLDKAHRKLTYRGEREVLRLAQKIVREHPERLTPPSHRVEDVAAPRPVAQQRPTMSPAPSLQRPPQPSRNRRRRRRGGRRPGAGNSGQSPQAPNRPEQA